VDIAREPHFGYHSDSTSGNARAIGLFDSEPKMRRFDRTAYFFTQFRE
jgi:hypothetical protein